MPTYEAWIPIVARVKARLYLDGPPNEEGIRNQSEFIERFRDFDVSLCHTCKENLLVDEGGLDYEEVDDSDIEITKIED
jgi:hypothetical protein